MDKQISMFDAEIDETEAEDSGLAAYKAAKKEKKRQMTIKQSQNYEFKKRYAEMQYVHQYRRHL